MANNKLFHKHNKGSLAKILNIQGEQIKDDYIKQYNDDYNGATSEQEQYRIATQLLNIVATI
jgi:hypothetical protein